MKKYYWVSAMLKFRNETKWKFEEYVTNKHPFISKADYLKLEPGIDSVPCDYQLLNWKEITKIEYDLFNDLIEDPGD
jgi:hypothetical protein